MANDSDKALKQWKQRVTIAKRKFNAEAKDKIEKARKYYKGDQWGGNIAGYKDKTVDNMVFSNIRTIMPSINLQNPKIFVTARKKPHRTKDGIFDTMAASATFELLTNYYWRELEIKVQSDKCLLDALLSGWGIMWQGHTTKTEKVQGGKEIEPNELIKEDSPFAIRIAPEDFLTDPEAKCADLSDARWVARRWVLPLNDVKKNPKYKNTKLLKATTRAKTTFTDKKSGLSVLSPSDTDFEGAIDLDRVEGWEIWDRENDKLITIVDSHDKFLQNEDGWPLEFGGGFPAEILYFNDDPDSQFPISDTEIYLGAQDELNRLRSLQLSHIRNVSQRKYIGNSSKFDEIGDEEMKLTDGSDGTVVWANGDPTNAIIPLKDANISQDMYITINSLKNNIREQVGVGSFEQGVAQKFDTATEPALLKQGLSIRRSERIAILESFLMRIARKLGKILQQTLKEDSIPLESEQFDFAREYIPTKLEKIVGEQESQIIMPWLNFSKDDIAGDYNFRIDVGSTAPINQEQRKQDMVTLSQLMAGSPYIDGFESTKRTLEAFDEKDIDKLMKTQEEVQQQSQQAQEQALQTEIAKDQPKRDTDLQKTQMKTTSNERTTLMKLLAGGNKKT